MAMRTFRPRWDRLGLLRDTTVRRPRSEEDVALRRPAVDEFRAAGGREMRSGVEGLYLLARVVLVVPVALIFAVEWVVATVWRGLAAVVNRLRPG